MIRTSMYIAMLVVFAMPGQSFELQDSMDGPWYQPSEIFDPTFFGEGFDEDWFVSKVPWVGAEQFWLYAEPFDKTEGEYSQAANGNTADGNPRDLYLARYIPDAPANTQFTVSFDYRFDLGDPGDFSNFFVVDIRDGDLRTTEDVADIESYQGHERPETTVISPDTFGTGEFTTTTLEHTTSEDADGFTLLMIIRFVTNTDVEQDNWFFLDNLVVQSVPSTDVVNWDLY